MNFLQENIGSARDNLKSPVHDWYKFTAGFSFKFVEEIINHENLRQKRNSVIYDPFAGCGTTLVSCQKEGISAVGNEGQEFMYDIIKAKLNWSIEELTYQKYLFEIQDYIFSFGEYVLKENVHPLLFTLYSTEALRLLYLIKDYVLKIVEEDYRLFFKLALSQTLHKVSIYPIAAPYISRNKELLNRRDVWEVFQEICAKMFFDTQKLKNKKQSSKIYLHDSRDLNKNIKTNSCKVCITSPPYLNNLDYGEVSKVHTHFFGITNSWNDITINVRKKLVTGSTTHYKDNEFSLDWFLQTDFAINNKNIIDKLIHNYQNIKEISATRLGKKSFEILMLLYFMDMYNVLIELRRILKPIGKAYLILGDSAPYGIYIPTTEIIGEIAINCGFTSFEIFKLRSRGGKWKSLKYRHSLELSESVLILK
ncbi:MAG: DNA methyltransferase [bacterium]